MPRFQLLILLFYFSYSIKAQQLAQVANAENSPILQGEDTAHHFLGLLDDMYQVRLSLSCSAQKCEGELTYIESETSFKVEGIQQGNELLLQEIDQQEAISGFIKAKWSGEAILGEWSNTDGSIGASIQLQKVDKNQILTNSSNEKWVKIYRGIILWDEVQMILHHLGHGQIAGSIYYNTQDEEKLITGQLLSDGAFDLSIKDGANIEEGAIKSKLSTGDSFRAEHFDAAGKRSFSSFELQEKIPVNYIEYAEYVMSYEILYPESTKANFNQWVKNYLKDWTNRCRSQVKSIKDNYPVCKPEARASERAYVWFEIEEIHNDLLVGQFFFSNTWQTQTIGKPINYNLVTGKSIEFKHLFKKSPKGWKTFKKAYIQDELRRSPRYMNRAFREWVKTEDFPLFTIQKHGIQFSTYYDEVHGQAKITIPYRELRSYMKKRTPINHLL